MYKVIGADGKEYGPVSADRIRQWIAEGRLGADTKAQVLGSTEWKPLCEFPEFAGEFGVAAVVSPTTVLRKVHGPAIGLILTAAFGLFWGLFALAVNVIGWKLELMQNLPKEIRQIDEMRNILGNIGLTMMGIAVAVLILYGGLKMRKLEGYNWAIAAAILAMIPCISPCCVIGLPIGIWALSMLLQPEVKAQFR
jgi:hypothetical protein